MFDFIIDTAPALSISDTSILITYADYNFIIADTILSRISQVKQTIFIRANWKRFRWHYLQWV